MMPVVVNEQEPVPHRHITERKVVLVQSYILMPSPW
jgi:hypothetical protein